MSGSGSALALSMPGWSCTESGILICLPAFLPLSAVNTQPFHGKLWRLDEAKATSCASYCLLHYLPPCLPSSFSPTPSVCSQCAAPEADGLCLTLVSFNESLCLCLLSAPDELRLRHIHFYVDLARSTLRPFVRPSVLPFLK